MGKLIFLIIILALTACLATSLYFNLVHYLSTVGSKELKVHSFKWSKYDQIHHRPHKYVGPLINGTLIVNMTFFKPGDGNLTVVIKTNYVGPCSVLLQFDKDGNGIIISPVKREDPHGDMPAFWLMWNNKTYSEYDAWYMTPADWTYPVLIIPSFAIEPIPSGYHISFIKESWRMFIFSYPADKIRGDLVRTILARTTDLYLFVSIAAFNFEVNYCEPTY